MARGLMPRQDMVTPVTYGKYPTQIPSNCSVRRGTWRENIEIRNENCSERNVTIIAINITIILEKYTNAGYTHLARASNYHYFTLPTTNSSSPLPASGTIPGPVTVSRPDSTLQHTLYTPFDEVGVYGQRQKFVRLSSGQIQRQT